VEFARCHAFSTEGEGLLHADLQVTKQSLLMVHGVPTLPVCNKASSAERKRPKQSVTAARASVPWRRQDIALFAQVWPTSRRREAERLFVPFDGSGATGAPFQAYVFESYWGDFWGYPEG
jgi:hypothetical protein